MRLASPGTNACSGVVLAPMHPDGYQPFQAQSVADYADENVKSGRWSSADAPALAQDNFDRLLPQGLATPDHYLYTIRDAAADVEVGVLWLAIIARAGAKGAYVYQLWIDPAHRRRGHARAAFEAMEPLVATLGATSIGLHVFGHNTGAQALYRSLGYNVTGVTMLKPLPVT